MKLTIASHHLPLSNSLLAFANRRLEFALGRFAVRVGRVSLRLADVNGPKGGVDVECVAVAQVQSSGQVIVRGLYPTAEAAIANIAERLRSLVQRTIDKQHDTRRSGRISVI